MEPDQGLIHLVAILHSQGQQLSMESLQQLLERALTPLLDEVKQKGLAPACPNCQRLHKKILVPGTMGCHDPRYFCVLQGLRSLWQEGEACMGTAGVALCAGRTKSLCCSSVTLQPGVTLWSKA